uniref:transglycosylase domain-containing protein n=1 Tax=Parerythrobacter lutipelagi TaxID=1964208 RepID=UPI0010F53326|nr:transglycosylase domain-containing protein [Parerythrobacter lutipelagi]
MASIFQFFRGTKGRDRAAESHRGYYSLYESSQPDWEGEEDEPVYRSGTRSPDYKKWDARLEALDSEIAAARPKQSFWRPSYWKGRRKRWWAVRIAAGFFALFILLVAWLAITAPLSKSLEPIAAPQITLLAADGTPIARNGAIVAEPVEIAELPPHVVDAFLSVEDRRFYDHWGVDPRGIARAAWTGYGGGSTITQQLAKFTFLTPERSLGRKGREMLIALWLETWLTKDEILERYLSNAYFGDNVYGLRAASLHFFYRKPENLKPEQAAMLAGLVQAPSRYNPVQHYGRAEKRMRVVISTMVANGKLTQAQAAAMPSPRIDKRAKNDLPTGTYFADWALPQAREMVESGYSSQTLTTTLDSRLQDFARRAVARAPLGDAQVALVAMRPNGEVVAMIGGKDYGQSSFNRVTQAQRQPGSTFKLFVYLAALEAGLKPDDLIDNTAIERGSYRPRNSGENYSESLTLEQAFARSSNVAAVRLFERVGDDAIIRTARDFGIRSPLAKGDPSLALGTSTTNLLEMTAAYAGVAGNSYPVVPRAVPAEEEGWFDWLWGGTDDLSSSTHEGIEQLLRAAINSGTGRAAMLRSPNFGKTGTSQQNRDALFIGYAGDLVVGVWIGNDDNTPLDGISGGGLPARIWRDFMKQALGEVEAPRRQRQAPAPDPSGPVQPMDDIPLGENGSRMRVREGEVTVSTQVEGVPIDIRLDENGLRLEPGEREPAGN